MNFEKLDIKWIIHNSIHGLIFSFLQITPTDHRSQNNRQNKARAQIFFSQWTGSKQTDFLDDLKYPPCFILEWIKSIHHVSFLSGSKGWYTIGVGRIHHVGVPFIQVEVHTRRPWLCISPMEGLGIHFSQ